MSEFIPASRKFPVDRYRIRSTEEKCGSCGAEPGFHCVEFTGQDFFVRGTAHPVSQHMVEAEPKVPA